LYYSGYLFILMHDIFIFIFLLILLPLVHLVTSPGSIHYIIGQISPNLFKVDATTLQSVTYRSSMMLNEVSSP
jgi:hypothetical protein